MTASARSLLASLGLQAFWAERSRAFRVLGFPAVRGVPTLRSRRLGRSRPGSRDDITPVRRRAGSVMDVSRRKQV